MHCQMPLYFESLVPPGHWLLPDTMACFSELVILVHSEDPQHLTVHERDEVVDVSADGYQRMRVGLPVMAAFP